MCADRSRHPIVHFVGSIPLPDSEIVFHTLSSAVGPHLKRVPDGETGIRKTWIRFLQEVLAQNPAIEVASDVPPFRFVQWDGKLLREIPRLRLKPGAKPDAAQFATGYADMAIQSWAVFERLQKAGVIPAKVKFQICIPTPIAPTYNNMVPGDRPALLPALTQHFIGEVAKIASALPNDRIALQWDVCQEVLAWEGYYEKGPVDFRTETLSVLKTIGDAVPAGIDLGYHLCYGSPADEHLRTAQGCRHHGRDDQRDRRRRQAADPVLPSARAQGAHRRRLLRAARDTEAGSGDRTLPRSHPPRRRQGRRHAACSRAAPRTRRRHRHGVWHGARRSRTPARYARRTRPRRRNRTLGGCPSQAG
jgi:hypothetical protein